MQLSFIDRHHSFLLVKASKINLVVFQLWDSVPQILYHLYVLFLISKYFLQNKKIIRNDYHLNLLRFRVLWIHLQWLFQGITEDIMNTMILGLYVCRQWKQSPRSFSQMFHESFFRLHEYIFSSSTSPRHTLLWRSPFHVVIIMILCGRGHPILNP